MGARLTAAVAVASLQKSYGRVAALHPTTLAVEPGEFLTLLGPSGSGKTTLLSLVAGLVEPSAGAIHLAGQDVTAWPAWRRGLGVVFQGYALFPHMTVAENVAFGLRMHRRTGIAASVARALALVRLDEYAGRMPRELSGGQQQRVALARALAFAPPVVLMDEPLGALDRRLREELKAEIRRIHRELGTTILYVTHDQDEAMGLSDRICLMHGGAVAELGTPAQLYARPTTRFAAEFLGESNLVPASPAGAGRVEALGLTLHTSHPEGGATILLRPERLMPGGDGPNRIPVTVQSVLDLGGIRTWLARAPDGATLRVTTLGGGPAPNPGDAITVAIDPADVVPLPA